MSTSYQVYLSLSGANLSLKAIAGPSEKEARDKILNQLKVSPKIPLYSKGIFSHWEIPRSAITLLYKLWTKDQVLVDKKAQAFVDAFRFSGIPLEQLPKEELKILPLNGRILKPHQTKFATYSYAKKGILIFDPTGAGKTTSMLIRAANMSFKRLLVVTTRNNWNDWEVECRGVLGKDPTLYTGTPKQREVLDLEPAEIVLTNYEQVKNIRAATAADFFDGIILDEAHLGANPESKGFKQIDMLLKANKDRNFTFGSTATPFDGDNLLTLWGLMYLIDPITAGRQEDFARDYQEVTRWKNMKLKNGHEYKKAIGWKTKNIDKLQVKLSTIMHKSDISAELKFKDVPLIIPMEMTKKQRDIYDITIDEYENQIASGTFFDSNAMNKCAKLFMIAEGIFDLETQQHHSTKHDFIVDYLKASDKKCVIWSAFVAPIEALALKFKDTAVVYNGSRSFKYKKLAKIAFTGAKDAVEEEFFYENCETVKDFPFREPKSAQFFLAVGARMSSEGVNLAAADEQIISSVNLSSVVTRQMMGRIKRLDTTHAKILTKYLAILGSVDVRYIDLVLEKIRKSSDLLDGKDSEISIKAREIVSLFRSKT